MLGAFFAGLAFDWAMRKTLITAGDGELSIQFKSMVTRSTKRWTRNEIHQIKVGLKSIIDHTADSFELQVHSLGREECKCLQELSQSEIEWIATEIKSALGIIPGDVPTYSVRDKSGRPKPTRNSNVKVKYRGDKVSITVRNSKATQSAAILFIAVMFSHQLILLMLIAFVNQNGKWIYVWLASLLICMLIAMLLVLLKRRKLFLVATNDSISCQIRGFRANSEIAIHRSEMAPLRFTDATDTKEDSYDIQICKREHTDVALFQSELLRLQKRDDAAFVTAAINEWMRLE